MINYLPRWIRRRFGRKLGVSTEGFGSIAHDRAAGWLLGGGSRCGGLDDHGAGGRGGLTGLVGGGVEDSVGAGAVVSIWI